MRQVRIGSGQGFWGDDVEAPRALVARGRLDYLVMDFLAEITMSIMQKQKRRDPAGGFASDIVRIMEGVLPLALEAGTKVVTNAGGINPLACARAVGEVATRLGVADSVRIAVVTGDDLLPRLDDLAHDVDLSNMDTGEPFERIADRVLSANAYVGAGPIHAALAAEANVVITGRCTDTALALGPLMHEHGWTDDDWDLLAAGVVAGHLIECGAQVTGGAHQAAWSEVPRLEELGYPIAEVDARGRTRITKPEGSGGAVTVATVTEQLLYEIGDPKAYLTPDVCVDWTSFSVEQEGPDSVVVDGARGTPAPDTLKVSICYRDGYRTALVWTYAWPDALAKARAAERIIRHKVARLGLELEADHVDLIGAGSVHGPRRPQGDADPPEVIVRYAARSASREAIARLVIELAPMAIAGPPGHVGFVAGGRGQVTEIGSFWPALIPRERVLVEVSLLDGPDWTSGGSVAAGTAT